MKMEAARSSEPQHYTVSQTQKMSTLMTFMFIAFLKQHSYKVWSKSIETEFISQTNCTAQGYSCDKDVLIYYCTFRNVYSSCHCFSLSWSAFKVRVVLSHFSLMMFTSTEQCNTCIEFCEMVRKALSVYENMIWRCIIELNTSFGVVLSFYNWSPCNICGLTMIDLKTLVMPIKMFHTFLLTDNII